MQRFKLSFLIKIDHELNGTILKVQDFRKQIIDYRILNNIKDKKEINSYFPDINENFLLELGYRIPAVKINEGSYFFPTNANNSGKDSTIKDYLDYCITDIVLQILFYWQ